VAKEVENKKEIKNVIPPSEGFDVDAQRIISDWFLIPRFLENFNNILFMMIENAKTPIKNPQ